jgi:hypothetical protein
MMSALDVYVLLYRYLKSRLDNDHDVNSSTIYSHLQIHCTCDSDGLKLYANQVRGVSVLGLQLTQLCHNPKAIQRTGLIT